MYGLPVATVRGVISVGVFDDTPEGTLAVVQANGEMILGPVVTAVEKELDAGPGER